MYTDQASLGLSGQTAGTIEDEERRILCRSAYGHTTFLNLLTEVLRET